MRVGFFAIVMAACGSSSQPARPPTTIDARIDPVDAPLAVRREPVIDREAALAAQDKSGFEMALRAGGKAGDTTTIAGLIVTVHRDPKRWIGKRVTLHAIYAGTRSYSSPPCDFDCGPSTRLIDRVGHRFPYVTCHVAPEHLEPLDPVDVTATISDLFLVVPELGDCTITARTAR